IAEMISDALTTGVVMDGTIKKPSGKPRTIFNKIIDFFKGLVGVAKDNDIDSFKTLVDSIQSGAVGRRERGQIRTPLQTEIEAGQVPERGITAEDIDLETGQRRRSAVRQVRRTGTTGELGDAPDVDEAMFSRRSDEGGLSAREMFSGTDPDMFNRETGEVDYSLRHKSRMVVVDMPIDMFLHLAASMEGARADSEALVRELAEEGKRFNMIPMLALSFESGKPEHRYVYDHDGRHRARQLKSMGYDTVPVLIRDASIRWDQQGEKSYDRVETWPRSILNQDGDFVFPMFLDRNANVRYGRFGPQYEDEAMFSRRRAVDVTDIISGAEQPPKLKGKKAVAAYLQNRTLERLGGVPRNIAREEDREAIADDLAREAVFEYENQDSAVEWYNETIDKTIEMLAEVHPEIKKDPGSRAAFLMSLAITSQNLAVPDNLALAEQAYNYYKKNGKFKVEGKGDKKKSMESNFKKANKLIEKMTPVEIEQFLRTEFVVSDLNKASKALLGEQADTGELAANTVYGSAIFGPKIGNGFYTNLRGDFSPVTMDMWFMRTMGRLAGTLTGTSKTKLDNAYKRFATAVGKKRVFKDVIERQAREAKSQHESDYRKYAAEFKSGKREKSEKTLAA
ncbi:MAG: hypothetical protein VW879_17290, partial [Opitutae bacterium]